MVNYSMEMYIARMYIVLANLEFTNTHDHPVTTNTLVYQLLVFVTPFIVL